jgi:intermembrane space import and assembly protein 40
VVAYRCFIDSKEEDKGSECIEHFRGMQLCFEEHPEHYKDFLSSGGGENEEEESELSKEEQEKRTDDWFQWNFPK